MSLAELLALIAGAPEDEPADPTYWPQVLLDLAVRCPGIVRVLWEQARLTPGQAALSAALAAWCAPAERVLAGVA